MGDLRAILRRPAWQIALPLAVGLVLFTGVFCLVWREKWFTGSEAKDPPAVAVLKRLRATELDYRARYHRWATLDTLHAEGISPVDEGGSEPASGYRFTSTAGAGRYEITATPPRPDMPAYALRTGFLSRVDAVPRAGAGAGTR